MEILNIESTEDNPKIVLDRDSHILEISGRSLPEDVNTASSKIILDILTQFEEMIEEIHKALMKLLALIIQQDVGIEESEKAYIRTFLFNIGFTWRNKI